MGHNSKYKVQHAEQLFSRLNLFDEDESAEKFKLFTPEYSYLNEAPDTSNGNLFDFYFICLNMFMRYNNGTNNCILLNKTNNTILNEFCDILFGKCESSSSSSAQDKNVEQIIYLKFLNQIFTTNFENLNKHKQNTSIATQLPSNTLFFAQFSLISSGLFGGEKQTFLSKYFLKICINYLYNYAVCTNFILPQSVKPGLSNEIILIHNFNAFVFEIVSIIHILKWPVVKVMYALLRATFIFNKVQVQISFLFPGGGSSGWILYQCKTQENEKKTSFFSDTFWTVVQNAGGSQIQFLSPKMDSPA